MISTPDVPEELSEFDYTDISSTIRDKLSDYPCFSLLKKSFSDSSFPSVITDNTLKLIWSNSSYKKLFDSEDTIEGEYLVRLFYPYLDDEKSSELYRSIRSKHEGFSWRGRVESSGREILTVVANMLVSPIFEPEQTEGAPIGYHVIFDDVTDDHRNTLRGTFTSLLEASKLKDNDTGKHIERVNAYSQTLAKKLFFNPDFHAEVTKEYIENIGFLAAMHDVGKIGTPDDILNKTGKLNDSEWKIMREHTINGAYILRSYPNPMAKDIALFHHEQWDGNGYPYQLAGDMIPLAARMVAVADVYDALRMKRSYKDAFTHEEAAKIIVKDSGTHFDPLIIRYFILLHKKFKGIYDSLADE